MKNIKKKFNLVELANQAFYTCGSFVPVGGDTYFTNDYKNPTRFLLVTKTATAITNANHVFHDYFSSEEYEDATQKKIHLFDLDGQFDYDYSVIKICKTKKYKAISLISTCEKYKRLIDADNLVAINHVNIDPIVREAFHEALTPRDFFFFKELKYEYRVSISIVKDRKVVKTLKCNLGHLTMIQTLKPFDYQETESEEIKATRPSLLNPVYTIDGVDVMVTFNDTNKYYKSLIEMLKI
ncbi:MAG: hypothetical protein RR517_06440 [Pseudomonas sp.]